MAGPSKNKLVIPISLFLAGLLGWAFELPINSLIGHYQETGFGDITTTDGTISWIIGFFLGFLMLFTFFGYIWGWKPRKYWLVIFVTMLMMLLLDLFWYALSYAVVGFILGWLWNRRRQTIK
jgi:membrane protease YdiL (CAAX protease family)